ncbi:MAG: hypothetical protein HGB31_02905 [Erysipelotrichaceae bacterium]|nr:hypothetical protein [Erysipelotrichaceae bacterium]
MKKFFKWYDRNFGWLFNWFIKHPVVFIFLVTLVTINLITRGEYVWSTIYIVMLFFIVSLFIFMQIDALKKNHLLRRVALYLMVFIGTSYGLVRFLKMIPEDYLVVGVDDWLGFAGGLFGGFIAIYGIWITLEETRKQNAETLALQSIPLITIDVPEFFYETDGVVYTTLDEIDPFTESGFFHVRVPFSLNNKSAHIARNFRFIKAEFVSRSILSGIEDLGTGKEAAFKNILNEVNEQLEKISALPGGYSDTLFINVQLELLKHDRITFEFILEYSDYLGKLSHQIENKTNVVVTRKRTKEEERWKNTLSNSVTTKNKFLK